MSVFTEKCQFCCYIGEVETQQWSWGQLFLCLVFHAALPLAVPGCLTGLMYGGRSARVYLRDRDKRLQIEARVRQKEQRYLERQGQIRRVREAEENAEQEQRECEQAESARKKEERRQQQQQKQQQQRQRQRQQQEQQQEEQLRKQVKCPLN